jgi:hypothetical protein
MELSHYTESKRAKSFKLFSLDAQVEIAELQMGVELGLAQLKQAVLARK